MSKVRVAMIGDVLFEDESGFWHCRCGNDAYSEGFTTVNAANMPVEPTPELWDTNNYACLDCGAVIEGGTRTVVAVMDVEALHDVP